MAKRKTATCNECGVAIWPGGVTGLCLGCVNDRNRAVARANDPGCSVEDCDGKHEARGFCRRHYYRARYRTGFVTDAREWPAGTLDAAPAPSGVKPSRDSEEWDPAQSPRTRPEVKGGTTGGRGDTVADLPDLPGGVTYCKRGHAKTPDNVYRFKDGSARCKTCARGNMAKYHAANPDRQKRWVRESAQRARARKATS